MPHCGCTALVSLSVSTQAGVLVSRTWESKTLKAKGLFHLLLWLCAGRLLWPGGVGSPSRGITGRCAVQ